MSGELLFESKGKITGHRVLTVENGIPKLEISIAGTGLFTGSQEVTTTWTYWAIQGPDGISYSQAQGVIMTKGRTVGKMVESEKMRYVGALFYESHSENNLVFS
jgi:hypothetical protein